MEDDLFGELQRMEVRQMKLRKLFLDFYEAGKERLSQPGSFEGLSFSEIKEPLHFDVSLAGSTARFTFSFDAKASRGVVACGTVDPWDVKKTKPTGEFGFNGQGDTEQKIADGYNRGDPIFVNEGNGASILIATYLRKAIRG